MSYNFPIIFAYFHIDQTWHKIFHVVIREE